MASAQRSDVFRAVDRVMSVLLMHKDRDLNLDGDLPGKLDEELSR